MHPTFDKGRTINLELSNNHGRKQIGNEMKRRKMRNNIQEKEEQYWKRSRQDSCGISSDMNRTTSSNSLSRRPSYLTNNNMKQIPYNTTSNDHQSLQSTTTTTSPPLAIGRKNSTPSSPKESTFVQIWTISEREKLYRNLDELQKRRSSTKRRIELKNKKIHFNWGSGIVNEIYEIETRIGEGTFGYVYKAKDKRTDEVVALKKVRLDHEKEGFPITAVREIKILKELRHPNIVSLKDVVSEEDDNSSQTTTDTISEISFYLVFEYCEFDLYGILDNHDITISNEHIASFMKQILEGLHFCHSNHFMHRDIKCSNILVRRNGQVKIGDFGLARFYAPKRPYTNKVITLWYRAPELLIGEEHYTTSIDIWSVGCILGELFKRRPIFQGKDEFHQLEKIQNLCGNRFPSEWYHLKYYAKYRSCSTTLPQQRRLLAEFDFLPIGPKHLLDQMLTLDPAKRISAKQALKCPWLASIDVNQIEAPDFPLNYEMNEMASKIRRKCKDRLPDHRKLLDRIISKIVKKQVNIKQMNVQRLAQEFQTPLISPNMALLHQLHEYLKEIQTQVEKGEKINVKKLRKYKS
ncbi:hypothetical protein SNEBB_010227 [Seison nebaliae]|nr:hypothetical protein SNEBB_010227 [Seison nebaliae]